MKGRPQTRAAGSGKTKPAGKPGSVVDSHSSGPGITPKAQATYPRARRVASSLAYLVLLPVEVAAFHPSRTEPPIAIRHDRTRLGGPIPRLQPEQCDGLRLHTVRPIADGYYPPPYPAEPGLSSKHGAALARRLDPCSAAVWPASHLYCTGRQSAVPVGMAQV